MHWPEAAAFLKAAMSFINSCLAGMAFSILRDTFSHFMGEESEFSIGFGFLWGFSAS